MSIMNILHTTRFYAPHIGGSEEAVKQLSERLVARGHHVTVATSFDKTRTETTINGVEIVPFDIQGDLVLGFSGPDIKKYQDFLIKGDFDLMMNYNSSHWASDLALPVLSQLHYKKVFVPVGFNSINDIRYKTFFFELPGYLRQYDQIVYLSELNQDYLYAKTHGLLNGVIIPNAANEDEFEIPSYGFRHKYNINTKYMLLNVANFYRYKGQDDLLRVMRLIKTKDVSLVIAGNPPPEKGPRWRQLYYLSLISRSFSFPYVHLLENVTRDMIVSAFHEADLFVFPSHLECSPLVILESLAAGLPFVSYAVGDVADHSEFGKIVSSPVEMAEAIDNLLVDRETRKNIGCRAKKYWKNNRTWEKITDVYEEMYTQLVRGKLK